MIVCNPYVADTLTPQYKLAGKVLVIGVYAMSPKY